MDDEHPGVVPEHVPETVERDGDLGGEEHGHGAAVEGVDQDEEAHGGEVDDAVAAAVAAAILGEVAGEEEEGEGGAGEEDGGHEAEGDPGVPGEGTDEEVHVYARRLRTEHQDQVGGGGRGGEVQVGVAARVAEPFTEADGGASVGHLYADTEKSRENTCFCC